MSKMSMENNVTACSWVQGKRSVATSRESPSLNFWYLSFFPDFKNVKNEKVIFFTDGAIPPDLQRSYQPLPEV